MTAPAPPDPRPARFTGRQVRDLAAVTLILAAAALFGWVAFTVDSMLGWTYIAAVLAVLGGALAADRGES